MSDLLLWLSGVAVGIGLGIHWMLRRQHRFYHWAMKEATEYFDSLLEIWDAERERLERLEPPAWFPEEQER